MIPALAAAHLLALLGTLLLVGGLYARRALTPARPPRRALGLGLVLLALGSGLGVAWTLADLGFLTPADTLAYLTGSPPGRAALIAVLGGVLLLAAELAGWPALLAPLPAAVLLWGVAGDGHGGTHGPGVRALTALHAGAMAVWMGGVLALLAHPALTPGHARRFTPVALACVVVLTLSGLVLSWQHGASLPALLGSGYGRVLGVKLAVFAASLLAALGVRRALATRGHIHRHLVLETALLLGVLGVTAALGTTPPPTHAGHTSAASR